MKKVNVLWIIPVLFVLSGCMTGDVSSDGAVLKQYLDPAALKELTENPKSEIWIIDVRPLSAYNAGHIPTAKSYPSTEVMSRISELPKTQYLIVYCQTGGRAGAVISKLEKEGYTRMMNWGGYTRWPYEFEKSE